MTLELRPARVITLRERKSSPTYGFRLDARQKKWGREKQRIEEESATEEEENAGSYHNATIGRTLGGVAMAL